MIIIIYLNYDFFNFINKIIKNYKNKVPLCCVDENMCGMLWDNICWMLDAACCMLRDTIIVLDLYVFALGAGWDIKGGGGDKSHTEIFCFINYFLQS